MNRWFGPRPPRSAVVSVSFPLSLGSVFLHLQGLYCRKMIWSLQGRRGRLGAATRGSTDRALRLKLCVCVCVCVCARVEWDVTEQMGLNRSHAQSHSIYSFWKGVCVYRCVFVCV